MRAQPTRATVTNGEDERASDARLLPQARWAPNHAAASRSIGSVMRSALAACRRWSDHTHGTDSHEETSDADEHVRRGCLPTALGTPITPL